MKAILALSNEPWPVLANRWATTPTSERGAVKAAFARAIEAGTDLDLLAQDIGSGDLPTELTEAALQQPELFSAGQIDIMLTVLESDDEHRRLAGMDLLRIPHVTQERRGALLATLRKDTSNAVRERAAQMLG